MGDADMDGPERFGRPGLVRRLLLRRRVAAALLALYSVALLVVVLEPFPRLADDSVGVGYRLLHALGAPAWVGPGDVEAGLNVALFVPVPVLGAFLAPRVPLLGWAGLVLLASATIELLQLVVLPGRDPAVHDVLANTLGGLVGAFLGRRARAWAPE
ncbi:MAG: VanZ family protein [Nocardioidaceae bacterium]